MARDYSNYSKEELLKRISSLEEELANKKYGIYYDKEVEPEKVVQACIDNIPVLDMVDSLKIQATEKDPFGLLIEGDNFHSLTCLNYILKRSIDIIYIDPPYNTGSQDFIYNDRFVDQEDGYRHSKWLNFMEKRLRLARDLLTDRGVIFISIDDHEEAQLKLLLDKIFGEPNFIASMIWSAGKKNDSRYVSVSHEYILCYAKSEDVLQAANTRWRERKAGIDKIYAEYDLLKKKYKGDTVKMQDGLREWYASLPKSSEVLNHKHYNCIDEKGVFFPSDISWPGGGGPKYEVLHPVTNKPVRIPARGWVYPTPERMAEKIAEGKIYFGPDETSAPCVKTFLKEREVDTPYSVFYQDGRAATKRLRNLLGADLFQNPKDETILSRLFSMVGYKDATILDFFAGSGTTAQSVLELNKNDGGSRNFILCTDNENDICRNVTYQRVKTVITGLRKDGTKYSDGIPCNFHYFKTSFIPDSKNRDQAKYNLVSHISSLLCISESIFNIEIKTDSYEIYNDGMNRKMFIYYDIGNSRSLIQMAGEIKKFGKTAIVYLFSTDNSIDRETEKMLPPCNIKPIPEKIYEIYKSIVEDIKND